MRSSFMLARPDALQLRGAGLVTVSRSRVRALRSVWQAHRPRRSGLPSPSPRTREALNGNAMILASELVKDRTRA
jgi:hypothetical protein